jgi:hypothetical protein
MPREKKGRHLGALRLAILLELQDLPLHGIEPFFNGPTKKRVLPWQSYGVDFGS